MRKPKINTKLIIDVAIADLVIDVIPGLINKFVSIPIDPMLLGGLAAFVGGQVFDRPNVSDAAIALTASTFLGEFLEDALLGKKTTVQDYVTLPESNLVLADYTNSNELTPMSAIKNSIYN